MSLAEKEIAAGNDEQRSEREKKVKGLRKKQM